MESIRRSLLVLPFVALLAGSPAAQQDAAVFDAALVVTDNVHRFERLLDLDGDGDQDAVGFWWAFEGYEDITVTGWLNDGNGELVETWSFVISFGSVQSSSPRDLEVGRLDADTRDDFAISFDDRVWLYRSDGALAPTLYASWTHPTEIESILLADYNLDGLDDLAVHASPSVELLRNQGFGQRLLSTAVIPVLAAAEELRPVDANGDIRPDLLLADKTRIEMYHVVNGTLAGQTTLSHGLTVPTDKAPHIMAGDLDGDLDEDVVAFWNGDYAVMRRLGPGSWKSDPVLVGGPATDLADVDGDGDLDGVCCSSGGGGPPVNEQVAQFEIAINDGTGAFAESFMIQSLGAVHIAGAADLDGDGDTDLVAGRVVYYADGPITPRQVLSPGAMAQQHVSDCDGDGDPDLFHGLLAPQRNLADGSFESFVAAAPAPPAGQLWAGPGYPGDFDGDGDVDLLVTRVDPGTFWPLVHGMNLLVNNGAGTLYDGGAAAAPGVNMNNTTYLPYMDQPAAGRAADADGDGDLDFIALSIGNPDQTKLWWNDGSGFFTAGPAYPGELVFAVEDMNGDTLPDLVMASNMLSVAFGLGGHAFSAPLVLPESDADNISDTYAAADLDGDGDVDVAGVNWHDDRLVVHMNDGAGNFTTDTTSFDSWRIDAHGSIDARVHAIDVDADGLKDLVVAPADFARETSLIFVKKNGVPGWEDPIEQAFETHAVADADGDGDDDVFDKVLLRNRAYGMPASGMRQQYGQGKAGADGTVPVIGASGPFRQTETAVLHMTGANAGAYSILTVGFAASDLPNTPWIGTTGYTWPWAFYFLFVMPGNGQLPGDGKLDLSFTVDPNMAGLGPLYHQVYYADPGAAWGRSTTGGLMIDYEP